MVQSLNITENNLDLSDLELVDFVSVNDCYKKGYFLATTKKNELILVATNLPVIHEVDKNSYERLLLITESDLYQFLEQKFSDLNTKMALFYLEQKDESLTAKYINYKVIITSFIICFVSCYVFLSNIFHLINNLLYFVQNILKSILFLRAVSITSHNQNSSEASESLEGLKIPIYSILVPLYMEENKVEEIVASIEQLEYPKESVDVKLIVEANDLATIERINSLCLPSYMHIIKVPYSLPQTKPKAMNYAMNYVKGEYVTVYDAEDRPHSRQLLDALSTFSKLPSEYVCLQARLNFYNWNKNILTEFFSIEYSLWFGYLLKGLNILNLPITLGGTSNHFKVEALKEVGYWDPYNVTEDADLGIRLYDHGYKVHILDSLTLEEAPTRVGVWLYQRSRWIRGFIQTLFVITNRRYKSVGKMTFIQLSAMYIFVGFTTYSFFAMPWLLFMSFSKMNRAIHYLGMINLFFSLIYMYSVACFVVIRGERGDFSKVKRYLILLIWPIYFVLHTIASYRAIFEICKSPFKWNKTPH